MEWKKYLAEVIGMFILVFCGCGAIVVHQEMDGAVTHVGICIVWGLVVMALIYALGGVSGCHINPAVTVALAAVGLFPWRSVAPYVVAQLIGAFAAAACLQVLFPGNEGLGGTYPSGSAMQSWVLELIMTFFLMLTVLFTTQDKPESLANFAAVAIGGVVLLLALFGGPISGTSLNPIRSLGPATMAGKLGDIWIYLTSPFLGALLGAGTWRLLRQQATVGQ